jgi:hypothetical protein
VDKKPKERYPNIEGLRRVYLHVNPAATLSQSPHVSFVSTSCNDISIVSSKAFQAAGIVIRSVLRTNDVLSMPEVDAKCSN